MTLEKINREKKYWQIEKQWPNVRPDAVTEIYVKRSACICSAFADDNKIILIHTERTLPLLSHFKRLTSYVSSPFINQQKNKLYSNLNEMNRY